MSDREAFEKWAKSERYDLTISTTNSDEYSKGSTCCVWFAWQAAVEHCKQGEEYWLYEIDVGQGVFQGCTGKDAEKVVSQTSSAFEGSGKPFRVFAHAMPKSEGIGNYLQEVHEVRHCDYCHHVGVDDAAKGMASCASCGWNGDEPKADICPACGVENHMMAACPKCNEQYGLVEYVTTASTPQPSTDVSEQLGKAINVLKTTEIWLDTMPDTTQSSITLHELVKTVLDQIAPSPSTP